MWLHCGSCVYFYSILYYHNGEFHTLHAGECRYNPRPMVRYSYQLICPVYRPGEGSPTMEEA